MSLFTLRTGATAHPEDSVLQFITDLITASGVMSKAAGTTHFAIQAQPTPDMTVKVKTGRAYLKGSSGNAYPVILDADTNVSISSNGGGSTRIDAVVLYIDKGASANSDASNVAKLAVVQGTTTAPSDGTIQSSVGASNPFLRLADISVGSGVTSIVTGNITDQRVAVKFQLSDITIQGGAVTTPSSGSNSFLKDSLGNQEQIERRHAESLLQPFVVSGLVPGNSVNLSSAISAGVAYVNGKRIITSSTNKTYTASKDTYVDLKDDGTFAYVEVANGATSGMTMTLNSDGTRALRVGKVITSGSAITGVDLNGFDPLGTPVHPTTPRNVAIGVGIAGGGATGPIGVSPDTGGSCSIYVKAYQNVKIDIPLIFRLDTDNINQFVAVQLYRNGTLIYDGPILGGGNGANKRVGYPINYLDQGVSADGYYTYSYKFNNINSIGLIYQEPVNGIVLEAM